MHLTYLFTVTVTPLEIAIAVDSSPSISQQNWQFILNYMRTFIQSVGQIAAGPGGTRFGLISYAASPKVIFTLNTLQGEQLTEQRVLALVGKTGRQSGQSLRIDLAIQSAQRDVFSLRGGSRPKARKVSCLVLLLLLLLLLMVLLLHLVLVLMFLMMVMMMMMRMIMMMIIKRLSI